MQEYVEIPRSKSLRDSRELILGNDKTIASHYSGTSFPSQYLVVGMECYRTDLKAKYRLTKTNPATWEPVLTATEIAKVKVNSAKAADYADNAGRVNGYYVAKDVPANAVFTDTWRPVEDRLTSTSPINALSALQGKLLNEQKAPKDSPKLTGKPTAPTPPAASNDDQIATTKFVQEAAKAASSNTNHGSKFITANTTFTVPAGVTDLWITARGGAGGGGVNNTTGNDITNHHPGGNGGAGGSVYRRHIKVTPGIAYAITIGAGGKISNWLDSNRDYIYHGGPGGTTSFGNLLTVTGGIGGAGARYINPPANAGGNGAPMESYYVLHPYGASGTGRDIEKGVGRSAGTAGAMHIEW